MRHLLFILLFSVSASAAQRVTLTIDVSSNPSNNNTVVVNGTTRTWKTSASTPSTEITIGAAAANSATNLFNHLSGFPLASMNLLPMTNATKINLVGNLDLAVTASQAGSWATFTYATQAVTTLYGVRVPIAGEPTSTVRTNIASLLVTGIGDYATNSFATNATALAHYLSVGPHPQTIEGPKTFWSIGGTNAGLTNGFMVGVTLTNAFISGTGTTLTNGWWTNLVLHTPVMTNAVNYGSAFVSYGTGASSLQLGSTAQATNNQATAVGYFARGWGENSTSIGANSKATNTYSTALGADSSATGWGSLALGYSASANATNSIAIGAFAVSQYMDAIAIGSLAQTTKTNQVRIGADTAVVSVPGDASILGRVAFGSDDYTAWPTAFSKGYAIVDGTAPTANATNSMVMWSVSGDPFYRGSSASETAGINARMHNRGASVNGSGGDYTLQTSYALLDFTGQDPELNTLPSAGTYLLIGQILYKGNTANDEVYFRMYDVTAASDVPNTETRYTDQSGGTGAYQPIHIHAVYTVSSASRIRLEGRNSSSARGQAIAANTKITYVRLY